MFKRVVLALTFVAALGAAGLGMSSNANAGHGCGYGYEYGAYYPSHYGSWGYGPQISYYRGYDRFHHHDSWHHGHHGHHGHRRHGHHGHGSGVHFSIGF